MRKLFLILTLVLMAIGSIFGQSTPDVFFKWAPATLSTGKITIGSEFNFRPKNSINFMIGIPSKSNQTITYDEKENDLETKAFSVLLGYRHYFGKKSARGFYVEPYAKYLAHQAEGILEGEYNDELVQMDTRSNYRGFGIGAQLGLQFLLFKRLSLDFYLLGLEANSSKFNSTSTDVANNLPWTVVQTAEAKMEVEEAIQDIPIIRDKMEVRVDQSKKTVTTDYQGFLPGLRFGASVGFRL